MRVLMGLWWYLETETIWPNRSPDLNPIEHAWDMLQCAISNRHRLPYTHGELIQAIHNSPNEPRALDQMNARTLSCSYSGPRRSHGVLTMNSYMDITNNQGSYGTLTDICLTRFKIQYRISTCLSKPENLRLIP